MGVTNMLKLLIVDDDDGMRGLMKKRLSTTYEIIETGHPTQAVELALAHRPDAILMDLTMPTLSGFELCRGLHDLSYTSRIPIFVVSGESDTRCREHCVQLGAVDYFLKPVDFTRLEKRLLEEFERQRPERRRSVRVQMKVVLQLHGVDIHREEFQELTSTDNVSVDGFLCQCSAALSQNSMVEVFLATGTEYRCVGMARVARRQDPDTPWQRYGFEFSTKTGDWVLQPV
jgi:two-component system cell cycle response regulator DivK